MLKTEKDKLNALMVLDFKINNDFDKISARNFKESKDFKKLIENSGEFIEIKKELKIR